MSRSIKLDEQGNIYTIGSFYGTIDFNPGAGVFNLTSSGFTDVYVSKLDNNGNFIWAKKMGGSSDEEGVALTLDTAGNIYMTGSFSGTSDFNPGVGTFNLTSAGGLDVFITKLDNNGNFIWAKKLSGTLDQQSTSICLDTNNNVVVAGYHQGMTDFDPGLNSFNINSSGGNDIFICRLDAAGAFQMAKTMGGADDDRCNSVVTDKYNNIYTTGYYMNTADLNPGPAVFNVTSTGIYDVFISKLDASGNFIFGLSLHGQYTDVGVQIALDKFSNIYICGRTEGNLDFDAGPGSYFSNASPGTIDIFIAKYTGTGSLLWGGTIGSIGAENPGGLGLDSLGNVFLIGDFGYTTDFDFGPGTYTMTSNGIINDNFICKYSTNGVFRWAKSYGGTSNEFNEDVFVDIDQNLYICGEFNDVVDFEPDAGAYVLTCVGSSDVFVEKFNPCRNELVNVLNITACDSFSYNDQTYFVNGIYRHIYPSSPCDSVVQLHLTLTYSSQSIDSLSSCDSLTWIDGITYTTDNNSATYTLNNSQGCDSVIHLSLDIRNMTTSVDSQLSCTAITWIDGNTYSNSNDIATFTMMNIAGCDSVIQLNFTFTGYNTADSINSCEPIIWIDSVTYATSNDTALAHFTSVNGCDSIVHLLLEIPVINDSLIQNSDTLFAFQVSDTYQWVNCDSGFTQLVGDTFQFFTTYLAGNYAVIMNINGCIDTSICAYLAPLGTPERPLHNIYLYPNPAQNSIILKLPNSTNYGIVRLYNSLGELVFETTHDPNVSNLEISTNSLIEGLYLIEYMTNDEVQRTLFVIRR
ncbi:MAG: T9SS type A sorting domain-containing protein [Bacteroidia bacterium]|nr:T9SS type A sorting domain-containing protein [Bacteroidia bacterium]